MAALSKVGSQSSNLISGSSAMKESIGGAFPHGGITGIGETDVVVGTEVGSKLAIGVPPV